MEKTQTVKLKHLRMAPRKVRLIVSAIKGKSVSEAEAFLSLNSKRAKNPVLKLLRSAISAVKENKKMDVAKLFISDARVDGGPMLKRFMPRAQGRATSIEKKTSHITLVIAESDKVAKSRFVFRAKPDKRKSAALESAKETEKAKTVKETKDLEEKPMAKTGGKGFTKKVFRRKAV